MRRAEVTTARRQFRRSLTSPAIACALVVALLVGGLPMLSGVAVGGDSQAAFTLDICHPVGGAAHTLSPFEAPLIPSLGIVRPPVRVGMAHESVISLCSRVNEAPNPPPPKAGA